jgi:hypothetical protein
MTEKYAQKKAAGLCYCGRKPKKGRALCSACLKRRASTRAKYKAARLCNCGRTPEKGKAVCSACLKHSTNNYTKRKAAGLCSCGRTPEKGKAVCSVCLKRRANTRAKRKAAGLCIRCGQQAAKGKIHCLTCLLGANLRSRVQAVLRRRKSAATLKLVGCTLDELKQYLEIQFQSGMTWENYGSWHIDHIKPFAAFDDLTDPEQQKEACHYSNLQPLWAEDNIRKGGKWD